MANSRETLHNEPHNRRTAIRSDENSHRKIENHKKVFSNQLQNKRNKRVKRVRIKGQKGIYCRAKLVLPGYETAGMACHESFKLQVWQK
ncbi:MAG: hypothetical protein MR455_07480 [Prevotella sp.]|nr:hypothetical protein [Prevotella sp.]